MLIMKKLLFMPNPMVRVNILPIIFTIRLTNVIPQPLVKQKYRKTNDFNRTILQNSSFLWLYKKDPSGWGRTIRKTLGLASLINNDKMEAAVKRAIHFNALSFNTLKNIIDRDIQIQNWKPIKAMLLLS